MIQLDTESDSFPADFFEINGTVFFVAEQEDRGRELWKTDGTVAGTEMVVLQANQLAETLDGLEVSRALAAIAWQADKAEQKLVGSDEN